MSINLRTFARVDRCRAYQVLANAYAPSPTRVQFVDVLPGQEYCPVEFQILGRAEFVPSAGEFLISLRSDLPLPWEVYVFAHELSHIIRGHCVRVAVTDANFQAYGAWLQQTHVPVAGKAAENEDAAAALAENLIRSWQWEINW